MNKENLFYICNKFYMITQYPLAIFHGDKQIHSCENSLECSCLPISLYPLIQNHNDVEFHWFENSILIACFPLNNSCMSIFIGALLTNHMKRADILTLLSSIKPALSYNCIQNLTQYLSRSRPAEINTILNHIEFLYSAINQTPLSLTKTPFANSKKMTGHTTIEGKLVENIETFYSQENAKYVEKLAFLIEHGMIEQLYEFIKKDNDLPYGKLGPNVLRHQKNSCIISTYIVRKAAQAGGLDETICLRLAEGYTQRFEFASNSFEISKISKEMRIDYCQRVHALQKVNVTHPLILKSMVYIHNHRMNKLDASIVANSIGISYTYLCSLFKKEAGMSLIDYIQKEKIDTAKTLLLFSDYTLSQISEYLSFSSQSYFQSVFKKVAGCTPLMYRLGRNQ